MKNDNIRIINKEEFTERMLKFYSDKRKLKRVKEKEYIKKQVQLYADSDKYDIAHLISYAKKRFSKDDYREIVESSYSK